MSAPTLIIVEDERIVALHTQKQLEKLGYGVIGIASSGAAALEKITEHHPDIVLMDIHIDGPADGIETASKIPPELNVAVIYVTAYSEEATLARARATTPYGYLIKPYSERELHATIQMALERRRANGIVQVSEQRFRSIFNAVSEGIFVVDAATSKFIDCNDPGAEMLGYSREELIGTSSAALSSGESPYTESEAAATIRALQAAGKPLRLDWQTKTKDGRIFPVDVSMRLASLNGQQVILSIVRDLTVQHAIEHQLRQAQKMEAVGNLTGGLAHDFNNLIGLIIGNIDLLRERISADTEADALAEGALSAALRGADLTKRLLAFARRQPLQPKQVDVNGLVVGLTRLLSRTLGEDIEIKHRLSPDVWSVVVDPVQLEACLVNIITNARDAMPDGGDVLISTRNEYLDAEYASQHPEVSAGDYTLIELTDSGIGMSEATVAQIFEPFFTTKEEGRGTGLGLSMVFGFVKQSAGHITVYSEPGSGSTFRIYLPRGTAKSSAEISAPIETPRSDREQTILVVEDNIRFRELVVRQLTQLGYRCLEADSGPAAIKMLDTEKIALLFSDVIMPGGIGGKELIKITRSRWPHVKLLLTSGFPEEKVRSGDAVQLDVRLLSKPYRKDELARAIAEVLRGQ